MADIYSTHVLFAHVLSENDIDDVFTQMLGTYLLGQNARDAGYTHEHGFLLHTHLLFTHVLGRLVSWMLAFHSCALPPDAQPEWRRRWKHWLRRIQMDTAGIRCRIWGYMAGAGYGDTELEDTSDTRSVTVHCSVHCTVNCTVCWWAGFTVHTKAPPAHNLACAFSRGSWSRRR